VGYPRRLLPPMSLPRCAMTADGSMSQLFLDPLFRAAFEASERGASLRGYFVWSFLDSSA
jgi:hypothetical protein